MAIVVMWYPSGFDNFVFNICFTNMKYDDVLKDG